MKGDIKIDGDWSRKTKLGDLWDGKLCWRFSVWEVPFFFFFFFNVLRRKWMTELSR